MKINVLGTEYNVSYGTPIDGADGECKLYEKEIVISDKITENGLLDHTLKHEIVHAYLFESGNDSAWDEKTVSWIAMQFDKMMKSFEEVKGFVAEKG